jgi:hypothetical protein
LGDAAGLQSRVLRLDIVDYPGEWLVDLPLLGQSFEDWSAEMIALASHGSRAGLAKDWLETVKTRAPSAPHDEDWAEGVGAAYADYLKKCSAAGLRYLQPGRFLSPAHLRGSPVLRFAPLPGATGQPKPGSLHEVFAKKFAQYQEKVVRGFYRKHFAGLDRQIVLVDALSAIAQSPEVFEDTSRTLASILESFRHGRSGPLAWLTGRRIEKVAFVATKADHVVRSDRPRLEELVRRMLHVLDESNRIKTRAQVKAAAIASVRCTEDMRRTDTGREILKGRLPGEAEATAFDPGSVPADFPPDWDSFDFRFWDVQPVPDPAWRHRGFPNIKLPEILDFLIGADMR